MRHSLLLCVAVWAAAMVAAVPARASRSPEIEAGYRLLYELRFEEARAQFEAWRSLHPEDPLGPASEAASYLFEEFYWRGVLTSEFFLDDKQLLGGASGNTDEKRRSAFTATNQQAQELARRQLKTNPKDAGALFALTISTGMQADYASLIERRQLESLRLVREAQGYAKRLLANAPDSADAYLTIGAANYVIGSVPLHKRFLLWFSGIHGDKALGIQQLQIAAMRGRYLQPVAKILLALAALREKQVGLALTQLRDLTAEFPRNPLFARELAKLATRDSAEDKSKL